MGPGGTKIIGHCLIESLSMSTNKLPVVASIEAGVVVIEEPGPLGEREPLIQPWGRELRKEPGLPQREAGGEGSNGRKSASIFPGTLGQIRKALKR